MIRKPLSSLSRVEEIQRFQQMHAASLGELTVAIRGGVPATAVRELATLLSVPAVELYAALGVSPSTIRRKSYKEQLLSLEQGVTKGNTWQVLQPYRGGNWCPERVIDARENA